MTGGHNMFPTNRKCIAALILSAVCILLIEAADYNAFLNIPGIDGGVKTGAYAGWIEVTNVSYNLQGIPSPAELTSRIDILPDGRTLSYQGKECEGKSILFLVKEVDVSTPKLMNYMNQDRRFPGMKLALCSHTGKEVATFNLSGVTFIEHTKSPQGNLFTINFEKLEFKYTGLN